MRMKREWPTGKQGTFVYLRPEVHRALKHRAVDQRTSLSREVERAVDLYLGEGRAGAAAPDARRESGT